MARPPEPSAARDANGTTSAASRGAAARPGRAGLAAALALAALLVALRLSGSSLFATAEGVALDLRFGLRGKLPPPEQIVIVLIDDRTIAALRRFPLPRATLATMVDRLQAAKARVIAFDLLLSDFESPSDGMRLSPGDGALFDALQRSGNVVLGAAAVFRGDGPPQPETVAALRPASATSTSRSIRPGRCAACRWRCASRRRSWPDSRWWWRSVSPAARSTPSRSTPAA